MSEPTSRPEGICVVHLVWAPLGLEPFRGFVAAYRRHPGGADHRLLIVYNGFAPGADRGAFRRELEGVAHEELVLPRPVQDLPAYFVAAAAVAEPFVCFLNSYSRPLDSGWLHKLHACLQAPGVGLVGATGSWASVLSHARLKYGLPSPYDGLFDRHAPDEPPPWRGSGWEALRWLKRKITNAWPLYRLHRRFDPFPAWHLRTNGFLLRRETMLAMRVGPIRRKSDAYRLENSRQSLTAQVLAGGRAVLVVGRDGVGYEKERWDESDTFWQADQGNLLIEDNQTLAYKNGGASLRRFYSRFAWGPRARPTPAGDVPSLQR